MRPLVDNPFWRLLSSPLPHAASPGNRILLGKGNIQGYGESFLPQGAWARRFLSYPEDPVYGFILCTVLIGGLMLFYAKTRWGWNAGCPRRSRGGAEPGDQREAHLSVQRVISCIIG